MARVLWTRQAIEDFDRVSERARTRVSKRIGLLEEFPRLGNAMDGPYDGFRQLLLGRHRVIYVFDEDVDEVQIAYIRDGARQLTLRVVAEDE